MPIPNLRPGVNPTNYSDGHAGQYVPVWVRTTEIQLEKGARCLREHHSYWWDAVDRGGMSLRVMESDDRRDPRWKVQGRYELLRNCDRLAAIAFGSLAKMYSRLRISYEVRAVARRLIESGAAFAYGMILRQGVAHHVIIGPNGDVITTEGW